MKYPLSRIPLPTIPNSPACGKVAMKGRLGPGQMIACNLEDGGGLEDNWHIKAEVAAKRPYGQWLRKHAKASPCFRSP